MAYTQAHTTGALPVPSEELLPQLVLLQLLPPPPSHSLHHRCCCCCCSDCCCCCITAAATVLTAAAEITHTFTMSRPPTSSPSTYNCGNVGQLEYLCGIHMPKR